MKVKLRIPRLFKRKEPIKPVEEVREEAPLPSFPQYSPEVHKLLQMIGDGIPSVRSGKAKDADCILVDAAALQVTLMTSGYEPTDILLLLASIYGATMGGSPEFIPIDNGGAVTREALEQKFFELCAKERTTNARLRGMVLGNNDNSPNRKLN